MGSSMAEQRVRVTRVGAVSIGLFVAGFGITVAAACVALWLGAPWGVALILGAGAGTYSVISAATKG